MKSLIKILTAIVFAVLFFATGIRTFAEECKTYTVISTEDGFALYEGFTSEGEPYRSDTALSSLLSGLPPCSLYFYDVVTNSFSMPAGSFTVSGNISLYSGAFITVPMGSEVTLDGAYINLASPDSDMHLVRVKGGALTVTDSEIAGGSGGCIRLDYSIASRLTLHDGLLSSRGELAAVTVEEGTAQFCGGSVTNTLGVAVDSVSELCLGGGFAPMGVGFDIVTDKPVSLTSCGSSFAGNARIRYKSSFSEGTLTEVLLNAAPNSLSGVTLFDSVGKEYSVTYFSSSGYTDEVNFGGIFLPYTVTFIGRQGNVASAFCLDGELVALPNMPELNGYLFDGFYLDAELTRRFDPQTPITSDIRLYAAYRLSPISFSISSIDTVYDQEVHKLAFGSVSHPLAQEGTFTYKWYKNGLPAGEGREVLVSSVGDSGVYSCLLTFHHQSNYVAVMVESITVNISPKRVVVEPPVDAVYNGSEQLAAIPYSDLYSVTQSGGTDAGTYQVTLRLYDEENFVFDASGASLLVLPFNIIPATNTWTTPPRVLTSYAGSVPGITVASRFGVPEILFSDSADGVYGAAYPTKEGDYYLICRVPSTDNYSELVTEPIKFTLIKDCVCSLTITKAPLRTEYSAFELLDAYGIEAVAKYYSGREEVLSEESLSVKYQQADFFLYGDNGTVLSYGGVITVLPITVKRAEYDISGIKFPDMCLVYDGEYKTALPPTSLPIGKDGIPITAKVRGGGRDAGSYTLTLELFSDSNNYLTPDSLTATLTVLPREVRVEWGRADFVYDGSAKAPSAVFTDIVGNVRPLSVSGAASIAGNGYIATAYPPSGNYSLINPTAVFAVSKANYDLSAVYWSADTLYYSGTPMSVTLCGLPEGVRVIGYTDSTATDAGEYTACAILDYDKHNYNPPTEQTHLWRILPIAYPTDTFSFSSRTEAVYDGETHYPLLVGSMPIGKDGSSPRYTFSRGAVHVSSGEVSVRISFISDSRNYIAPDDIECTVVILPKEITVSWGSLEHTYDGTEFLPTARSLYCELNVTGAATNAGVYTAACCPKSTDFTVLNNTVSYKINKAENRWLTLPTAHSIYESGLPQNNAMSLFGESELIVYSDMECTDRVQLPLSYGSYFLRFRVEEGDNYLQLISPPIPLTVIEVVPITLSVSLTSETFVAFESLTDKHFVATVTYNDGRCAVVTDRTAIKFQNGSSLLAGDTRVVFSFGGLTHTAQITVERADYDLSNVRWQSLSHIYDGTPKSPYLDGLPDGVRVIVYEGAGRINAGSYTVTATLSYDEKNYNKPVIEGARYLIEKKAVTPPSIAPLEYNGQYQAPLLSGDLFKISSNERYKNAGLYTVSLTLTDTENYKITGTNGAQTVGTLEIKERPVFIAASDVLVYKWSRSPEVSFTVTEGGILFGDNAEFYCSLDEQGRARFLCTDPNYIAVVTGADVIYINRPHPSVVRTATLSALLLFLILLGGGVLYIKRDALLSFVAAKRCKRNIQHNRPLLGVVNPYGDLSTLPSALTNELSAFTVDMTHADSLISDSLAKNLVKRESDIICTEGRRKCTVNIDTLSKTFTHGAVVDINVLKREGLVPRDAAYLKVLARGRIDKPLTVLANDFSLCAVKMIVLTGGEARRVTTVKMRSRRAPRG